MKRIAVIIILVVGLFCGCEYVDDIPGFPGTENSPPTAFIDEISPSEAMEGEKVIFQGHGVDVDGTVLAYYWESDIDGELSDEPNFETSSLSPGTHTITFRVQDNNRTWSDEFSSMVIVSAVATDLPVIRFFNADPDMIVRGDSSVLSWDVVNATSLHIDNAVGDVEMAGTTTVSPQETVEYTLTASNDAGSVYSGATVIVTAEVATPGEKTLRLSTIPEEDGTLVKYSSEYVKKEAPCAGDDSLNLPNKAFLSFDISGIPAHAVVQEAILDLSDYTMSGNPTYTLGAHGNMGALEIYFYQYGNYDELNTFAYNRAASIILGGGLIEYPLSPWELDVTRSNSGEDVIQDLVSAGESRCQFRLQFFTTTNWDGVADMFCFDDATLTIKYMVE
jgi:hypothetical protein